MAYKWINQDQMVRRLSDGACIPNDSGNTDWREFLKWVEDGGVCEAADPTPAPIDQSDLDVLERRARAMGLTLLDYCNQLKAEARGLAVLLVNKGVITAQEALALKAFDGSGTNDARTPADFKSDFADKYNSLGD